MTDEPRKRARRCAACIYCHTVSTRELPFEAGVGDFCVYETRGELVEERSMTAEFYEGGECPAGRWENLPEIDHEHEAAIRKEGLVAEQIRRYGPVLEGALADADLERIQAVLEREVTEGRLEPEAAAELEARLTSADEEPSQRE